MSTPTVICLTPVKNEAWILERFLRCASLWADHIIIADQNSDDRSREIARRFEKVRLIENPSAAFNEPERQQMLIRAARDIPGPRVLIALDADEFLTANFHESAEWRTILSAPPGTVLRFLLPTVLANARTYYLYQGELPMGFVDDGSEHHGKPIHSPRVPVPPGSPSITLSEIQVMHYVGLDEQRWLSKLRWYQCWELLHQKHKRPVDLFRFYHKDIWVGKDQIHPLPHKWLEGYEQRGIDMTSVSREAYYRWDKEVLQLFKEVGTDRFRRLAIWDVDWRKLHESIFPGEQSPDLTDPRSRLERWIHRWLASTQHDFTRFSRPPRWQRRYYRFIHRLLGFAGW